MYLNEFMNSGKTTELENVLSKALNNREVGIEEIDDGFGEKKIWLYDKNTDKKIGFLGNYDVVPSEVDDEDFNYLYLKLTMAYNCFMAKEMAKENNTRYMRNNTEYFEKRNNELINEFFNTKKTNKFYSNDLIFKTVGCNNILLSKLKDRYSNILKQRVSSKKEVKEKAL